MAANTEINFKYLPLDNIRHGNFKIIMKGNGLEHWELLDIKFDKSMPSIPYIFFCQKDQHSIENIGSANVTKDGFTAMLYCQAGNNGTTYTTEFDYIAICF